VPADFVEEARSVNEEIEAALGAVPPVYTVPPRESRRIRAESGGIFGPIVRSDKARDSTIPGPSGPLPVRIVSADDPAGVYLHIHGGGWTLGAADQQDQLLTTLSEEAGVAVVSVEYRLGPEAPYPAAADDCEAAACWLVEHALEEFGTATLLIGGESAGAHLSAVTLLRLRDRHGAAEEFRGANLVFGAFDLSLTPSARNWGERNLILSTPIIEWFADQFLPDRTPEQRRDPSVSPLFADLHDLPPALFTVGALDPLIDDSTFMCARWNAAGNEGDLRVYPESVHGFEAFPTRIARHAVTAQIDFVKQVL
jgi:acetyl esterase